MLLSNVGYQYLCTSAHILATLLQSIGMCRHAFLVQAPYCSQGLCGPGGIPLCICCKHQACFMQNSDHSVSMSDWTLRNKAVSHNSCVIHNQKPTKITLSTCHAVQFQQMCLNATASHPPCIRLFLKASCSCTAGDTVIFLQCQLLHALFNMHAQEQEPVCAFLQGMKRMYYFTAAQRLPMCGQPRYRKGVEAP